MDSYVQSDLNFKPVNKGFEAGETRLISFDFEDKPRLSFAYQYIETKNPNFEALINLFREWRDYSEYLIFKRTNTLTGEVDYPAFLGAKRGNPVYNWRLKKKFDKLKLDDDYQVFNSLDRSKRHKTNIGFLTLTYDRDIPLWKAWDKVGDDWNRLISNLRGRFGRVSAIRVWEAQSDGYPHIHAVLVFHDREFEAFFYQGNWRIQGKDDMFGSWDKCGFSDLQAMGSLNEGLDYLKKYLTKTHKTKRAKGKPITKAELTLALMWIYQKRAYAISDSYLDLISRMSNSKSGGRVEWLDLMGEGIVLYKWELIGFWGGIIEDSEGLVWSLWLDLNDFFNVKRAKSWNDFRF